MSRITVHLILGLSLALAVPAYPATFVVNSAGDGPDASAGDGMCATTQGQCTLRAAIQQANALAGADTITFSIGSGPQSITLTSALPKITDVVVIDGTTQPGFTGAPLIELDGSGTKAQSNGLFITAGNSTVRGLVINGFPANGIKLNGQGGNVVEGSYVGIDLTGSVAKANGDNGVSIEDCPNNRVGGLTAAARNVISGNLGLGGVAISGVTSTGNLVQGNYIGLNASGTGAIKNDGRGVVVQNAPNNTIGGTAPGARNIISGNNASGIRVFGGSATGNTIQGNYVGADPSGKILIGNTRGVQTRSNNTIIGGPTPEAGNLIVGQLIDGVDIAETASDNMVQGNIIAYNGGIGVAVGAGTGNSILNNNIFGNRQLGIDLVPYGVTPNDPGDVDTGANNLQNFPVINSAASAAGGLTVMGTLGSTPSTLFTLQFFANTTCDISGNGEGQRFAGQAMAQTDGTGQAAFASTFAVRVPTGQFVTATATGPDGSTSEFSACVAVTGP